LSGALRRLWKDNMEHRISFKINGEQKTISVSSHSTLLEMIRDQLHLTGSKVGCANGECGACTIIMDGEPVRACLILAVEADGRELTTIEGVSKGNDLTDLQKAFVEEGAVQCGFCTPGFVMAGEALLKRKSDPSDNDIKESLGGHVCRCTGYEAIFSAFKKVSKKKRR